MRRDPPPADRGTLSEWDCPCESRAGVLGALHVTALLDGEAPLCMWLRSRGHGRLDTGVQIDEQTPRNSPQDHCPTVCEAAAGLSDPRTGSAGGAYTVGERPQPGGGCATASSKSVSLRRQATDDRVVVWTQSRLSVRRWPRYRAKRLVVRPGDCDRCSPTGRSCGGADAAAASGRQACNAAAELINRLNEAGVVEWKIEPGLKSHRDVGGNGRPRIS